MDLKRAQQHLSQDARYRRLYAKHRDRVVLAIHAMAIRKELGITHAALADELGISTYDISKFENLKTRVAPWVISQIVTRFQNELRKRGIDVERWFAAKPPSREVVSESGQNLGAQRPTTPILPTSRNKGTSPIIDRDRSKNPKSEDSKP